VASVRAVLLEQADALQEPHQPVASVRAVQQEQTA